MLQPAGVLSLNFRFLPKSATTHVDPEITIEMGIPTQPRMTLQTGMHEYEDSTSTRPSGVVG